MSWTPEGRRLQPRLPPVLSAMGASVLSTAGHEKYCTWSGPRLAIQAALQHDPLPSILRLLSTETRAAIDQAVSSKPVVLFMKGTPEIPQCGFSRPSIQILGLQGVDPQKFAAFNVLEDEQLRQGMHWKDSKASGGLREMD